MTDFRNNKKQHVVLEQLLVAIKHDGSGVGAGIACDMAEKIFNVQEEQIDSMFQQRNDAQIALETRVERVKQLEIDYESVLMDYERTDDKLEQAYRDIKELRNDCEIIDDMVIKKTERVIALEGEVQDLELLYQKSELSLNMVNEQMDDVMDDAYRQLQQIKEVKEHNKVLNAQLDGAHDQVISLANELDVHDRITSAMIKQFGLRTRLDMPADQQENMWETVKQRIKMEDPEKDYVDPDDTIDEAVIVVDNINDAIKIKNAMWYPINIRPMGIAAESVDVSNDAEFIRYSKNMLTKSPCDSIGLKESEIVEKYDMADDALDLINHSITVENLPDAIDGAYAIGYPVAISACGVTESEGYVSYNEGEFILMAYDMLVSSTDTCITLSQYTGESTECKMKKTMDNIRTAAEKCCGKTKFEELMDVNDAEIQTPQWDEFSMPTYEDYFGEPEMDTLDKLHYIEDSNTIFNPIYNIHYCNAGVGIIFYDPTKDTGNYKDALTVDKYYPTFEDCINAEYDRMVERGSTKMSKVDDDASFDALCLSIYEQYHDATWGGQWCPSIDNGQLVDVVDIVIKRTGVGFGVGLGSIYEEMRAYVIEYGNSGYWMDNENT